MKTSGNAPSRRSLLKGAGAAIATGTVLGFPSILRAQDPIRIGVLAPLSGALAIVGEINRDCTTLAVEEINAGGGILGRQLEVVVEDGQMSTRVTVDKARKLVDADGVSVITGTVLPSEREAVLQVASEAGIMAIHPNNDEGRCHPNLLTSGQAANQAMDKVIPWLVENVGGKVMFIASDLGTYRDVFAPTLKRHLEAAGGSLVGEQYFPFGTRDYGPVLQQIKSLDPDIVMHLIGDDPITLVKQYGSFGLRPKLVSQIAHESINAASDGAAVGSLAITPWFMTLDNPANRAFVQTYHDRFKGTYPRRAGEFVAMRPHGEAAYSGMKVWAEAARIAGILDVAAVREALPNVSLDLPRGPTRGGVSHLLSSTYVGEARADNLFDVRVDIGVIEPVCG